MTKADMLICLNYDVVEMHSAELAMKLVRHGLKPDPLITDHLMPRMTGSALARTLPQDMSDLKVLTISGNAELEGVAPDLARLTKPFLSKEYTSALTGLDLFHEMGRHLSEGIGALEVT